ncbi:secretory pathway protein Sec39-domain-containing protein [Flagelloscypha sp. PMI_526]|nr:secretory pathway protein Sec39-domain-containing protein [Flagelloscypha sp. PMI_526]
MSDPATLWETLSPSDVTPEVVANLLSSIKDDLWVVAACADQLVDTENDDVALQRRLLELGLERTLSASIRAKETSLVGEGSSTQPSSVVAHFNARPEDAELCHVRRLLLARLDRLGVYEKMVEALSDDDGSDIEGSVDIDLDGDDWDDDPWAEQDNSSPKTSTKTKAKLPFTLTIALTAGLLEQAILLASTSLLKPLQVFVQYFFDSLWPHRFKILENIPEHVDPSRFAFLLPSLESSSSLEQPWPHLALRDELDWTETPNATEALAQVSRPEWATLPAVSPPSSTPDALSPSELELWYKKRVDETIEASGMIDIALSLVQHGASQGIPDLDSLGEELSLLSRLVYDTSKDDEDDEDWTLARWRAMDPSTVVSAYLAHSSPDSLQNDVQRLVMPYLFVLESRAERDGRADPDLPQRLLYEHVLNASLERVADVFEASKPTLPQGKRILRNDEDMARLALACLYGNSSLDSWPTMSRIFECLPAWELDGRDGDGEEDAMDMTIVSLGEFVQPTTTHSYSSPSELLVFFKPLPLISLSRALDILDVHLESGEILSRWGVPAPLSWFLQSHHKEAEQRAWANKMARRAGGDVETIQTQEDWEWLLGDMLKLCGKGEHGLKGAFGLIPRDDVKKIFFSGLLSTGAYDIAKSMLAHSKKLKLSAQDIEEICLSCSRELYDNASSGNFRFGEMKMAYDCLEVARESPIIRREKDFIEATSRLSSFNIVSRPGLPISPIEIRLTKDRLSLVSRVLSSNEDAYRHTEVILDLGDAVAEIKALAMISETAMQAEDFKLASENAVRMVSAVEHLRSSRPNDPFVEEANLVSWVCAFQLGRQSEFEDTQQKLFFLGKALEFCPPGAYTRLEDAYLEQPTAISDVQSRSARRPTRQQDYNSLAGLSGAASLRDRLQQFHMPSPPLLNTPDAAALASKTFRSVRANFSSFRSHSNDGEGGAQGSIRSLPRSVNAEEVQKQASRALSAGIGWLIGAEE